jgi:ABC-type bacteriocin/lantibiotic exporter with double-glycine peptidase domain
LLPISHLKQRGEADCLAACAAAVLALIGRDIDYSLLLQMLEIRNYGAPAGNIRRIAGLGLSVTYSVTEIEGLFRMLDSGLPVIVFLRTGDLPYWSHQTDHAVVVVGYDTDAELIYLNDPYFDQAPIAVPRAFFELAWLERDYYFATISL